MLDIKGWLKGRNIPDEKHAEYLPILEPFYNELTAAVTQMKTDLDGANAKLNADMAEWASLTAAEKSQATELRNSIDVLTREKFDLSQKIARYATENGIDPKTIIGDVPPPVPPKKDEPPPVDLSKYPTADAVAGAFNEMLDLQFGLPAILAEHQALFGSALNTRDLQKKYADRIKAKKPVPIMALWEEEYKVGDARTAAQKKVHDAEITAAETRGYERRATEAAIPGHTPAGRHAPIFQRPTDDKGNVVGPKAVRPVASSLNRISRAASALATHRYAKPEAQAAAK